MDTLQELREGRLAGARRLDLSVGLNTFPREILQLAETLEVLNLSGNALTDLPADFDRLQRLKIFFCSYNHFEHLPEVLGRCPQLRIIGLRANRITHVSGAALPPRLRALILTDNRIETLPDALGQLLELEKLMLSGNRLRTLPASMAGCSRLELLRIAANDFAVFPEWLAELPSLAWLACGGNPANAPLNMHPAAPPTVDWQDLQILQPLGEGASGVIFQAQGLGPLAARQLAVKLFKNTLTSDGTPESEISATLAAGSHPNLIPVVGRVTGHPQGTQGLAMDLIGPQFRTLANPPSLESCTRDVYPEDCRFDLIQALRIAACVAAAAAHLHGHRLLHGDLYAHNVLSAPSGDSLLGDLGAAAAYQPAGAAWEGLEVRAWGILFAELLARCDAAWAAGHAFAQRCQGIPIQNRPTFAQIVDFLHLSQSQFAAPPNEAG